MHYCAFTSQYRPRKPWDESLWSLRLRGKGTGSLFFACDVHGTLYGQALQSCLCVAPYTPLRIGRSWMIYQMNLWEFNLMSWGKCQCTMPEQKEEHHLCSSLPASCGSTPDTHISNAIANKTKTNTYIYIYIYIRPNRPFCPSHRKPADRPAQRKPMFL